MLVHTFSPANLWFDDFAFFGKRPAPTVLRTAID